tara:strand:- start:1072 stop:1635 length:564 start_codon:yes stop_codon:yes gene_type:complete
MPLTYRMVGSQISATYTFGTYSTLASFSADAKPQTFTVVNNGLHDDFMTEANHKYSYFTENFASLYEMKIITLPTLQLSRLGGASGDVTASIRIGIGAYDESNPLSWRTNFWNIPGSLPGNASWQIADIDQDNVQTNYVSVGDTRIVASKNLNGYSANADRQGFKTACTFFPNTQVLGNFEVQITRL